MSTIKVTLTIEVNSDDKEIHNKIRRWISDNTHHISRYNFAGEDEDGDEVEASIEDVELTEE